MYGPANGGAASRFWHVRRILGTLKKVNRVHPLGFSHSSARPGHDTALCALIRTYSDSVPGFPRSVLGFIGTRVVAICLAAVLIVFG